MQPVQRLPANFLGLPKTCLVHVRDPGAPDRLVAGLLHGRHDMVEHHGIDAFTLVLRQHTLENDDSAGPRKSIFEIVPRGR